MKTFTHSRKGFTLVEVMVAEAVFLVLLVVVMQLVFTATKITQHQKQQVDAMTEARQALDRMKLDWTARVRRGDVTAVFSKKNGNDQFRFLSQIVTYDSAMNNEARKPLAVVSYRINDDDDGDFLANRPRNALLRGALGYVWGADTGGGGGGASRVLTFPFDMPNFDNTEGRESYEVMGRNVFRMEICFLRKLPGDSGAAVTSPYTNKLDDVSGSAGTGNPAAPSSGDEEMVLKLTSSKLAGVVVCVAVIGELGKKILDGDPAGADKLRYLAQQLEDVSAASDNDVDPYSKWMDAINRPDFAPDVPRPVAASIRVYQRIFYVNE